MHRVLRFCCFALRAPLLNRLPPALWQRRPKPDRPKYFHAAHRVFRRASHSSRLQLRLQRLLPFKRRPQIRRLQLPHPPIHRLRHRRIRRRLRLRFHAPTPARPLRRRRRLGHRKPNPHRRLWSWCPHRRPTPRAGRLHSRHRRTAPRPMHRSPRFPARPITFPLRIRPEPPPMALTEPSRLRQRMCCPRAALIP